MGRRRRIVSPSEFGQARASKVQSVGSDAAKLAWFENWDAEDR